MFEGAPPALLLIGDRFTEPGRRASICEAVRAGVRWVQLRDHDAPGPVFEHAAAALIDRLRKIRSDVWISLNAPPEFARRYGVGAHFGRWAAEPWSLSGTVSRWTGSSVHTLAEAQQAQSAGQAYVLFSPIFTTSSKPGHPGHGTKALEAVCRAVPELAVFALGGVTPERVPACRRAGAAGIAVLSGLLGAPDVAAAVDRYQRVLTETTHP